MGRAAVRLTEVVYTISPMKVGVMGGLFKDWGNVMGKKVWGWKDVALFGIFPVIGTFQYTEVFNEKQKLAHRF
eukprot:CAMPEP_0198682984 /NCGR_PEP_ID=MMETSP1468-20131203/9799_1 /TAXON_ID=1461545 /ORGANISM="Mantoniella sp, Strain CCMP1436" /LENGTH=72 /DNA_ID=CAMNT_0044426555 /DNA_START=88 /DNA_END=306 /DNA_ORIENTATION=-